MKNFIAFLAAAVIVNKILDNRSTVVASRSHQPAQKSVVQISKTDERAPAVREYTPQPKKGHLKLNCACTDFCYCGNCTECYGGGGGECDCCSSSGE